MKAKRFMFLLAVLLCSSFAIAQESPPKYEVGAQFTYLHLRPGANEFGVGSRFSFNFKPYLAFDSEWDITPANELPNDTNGGRRNQFFFGAKAGLRRQRFGLFAKARPGFIVIGNVVTAIVANSSTATLSRRTEPSLDLGGVIEFYPSSRWLLRTDIGDTVIFYRDNLNVIGFGQAPGFTKHTLQISSGISFRF